MPDKIRLYDYWRSTASYRVRIGLNLADLEYESVQVDLVAGDQGSQAHRLRNPQELVPVLEIDGLRLTQSMAILDYLQDTGRLDLIPADPARAAEMRAISQAIACDIHPVCNLRVVNHLASLTKDAESRTDWMRHFIRPGLVALEAMLARFNGPYCMGQMLTQADLILLPQLYNADRWGVDVSDLPRIGQVAAACNQIPAFTAAHPEQFSPPARS